MLTRSTVLALLALLLAVPPAGAADFNVTTSGEFSSALVTAASNGTADRILLAAGTYTGPFTYNAPEDLEVLGAGAAATTIALSGAGEALYLEHPSAHYHVA